MSTHNRIDLICVIAAILMLALTVLFMSGEAFGPDSDGSGDDGNGMFTGNDLDADWDVSLATEITLSDAGSTISGNGAYIYNGDVHIIYAGHYTLTGELANGSVVVDADKTDKIWLLLDGVSIHCEDGAAIRIEQADKAFLTLAEGTKNTVSSGEQYDEDAVAAGVDGVIYSRDDLTINGKGSLIVDAEYRHGIVGNDDLVIAGGNITINALQDGIHANDSVRVRDAEIMITAGDDGITVSNDDETAFLYMESGIITIPECYEGLEAVTITIAGGTINITPTDDGINANGRIGNPIVRITGGDITIINPSGRDADGLDSNGSIYIEGGRVFISVSDSGGNYALDCGTENGGECIVSGGTVIACGGSGMAEGFDAGSTQGFLMQNTNGAAGTTVILEDAAGKTLISEEIPCSFSSIALSAPGMKIGDVCSLTVGEVQEEVTIDNVATSGFGRGGIMKGGMRSGQDFNRGAEWQENSNNQGNGGIPTDMSSVVPDGEGRSAGMNSPDSNGQPNGTNPPDGGMEPPGGTGFPNSAEPPDRTQIPAGTGNPAEGTEPSDETQSIDGTLPANRADRFNKEDWANRQGMADAGQFQDGGMHFQQREEGVNPAEAASLSNLPPETPALLGISIATLLIGLLIAVKTKH